MVVTCEFGELADEMIQDQLIEKTNSSCIGERLLLVMELTLQKAITMAGQIESAMVEAQIIGQDTASDIQSIHPVQTQDSQSSKRPFRLAVRGTSDERHQPAQGKTCCRCGSLNHTANYHGCPGKDAQCNSCKKRGHC